MLELIKNSYQYRELIWILAMKELNIRYKRSVLGFVWALLHPLLMTVVLTIVFSSLMRFSIEHYAIFLICCLFPWTFFTQSMAYGVESVIGNAGLLRSVHVPQLVFPVSAILANLINFLFSMIPLALLLVVFNHPFHATWLYLPVPLLALVLFTMGCGFFFAALNVFFRDVSHIVQILLTAWFYFSPILYSLDFVSPKIQIIFRLNPMLYILGGFRSAIYHGVLPSPASIALSLGFGMIALVIGFGIFRRYQNSFVFYV